MNDKNNLIYIYYILFILYFIFYILYFINNKMKNNGSKKYSTIANYRNK
jgi:hypothetical protein